MNQDHREEDRKSIERVLAGESHVYGVLVERYERLIFSFLLPQLRSLEEVEDLAQEVFIRGYRHLASFDTERKFSSWIIKIARNLLIDQYRKNAHTPRGGGLAQDLIENAPEPSNQNEPAQKLELQEEFRTTFKEMLDLAEELRIPLLLRVMQELSYEEIAEILDLPLQTVKNRIFKARSVLREKRKSSHGL